MTTRATTTRAMTTEAVTATSPATDRAGRPEPWRPAQVLAELFEAYAPLVLGICRGTLRDPDEAEDAAQQAFLSAYASLLGGTRPRAPAAWLATIARNECRSRVQRRMREPLPEAGPEPERSDPTFRAAQAAEVNSLRLALARLPRRQRHAFLLREFSGLSYTELAVALGVSEPAVESLLFRARRQLRGALRTAVAAPLALPGSLRDFFAQLAGGSPAGPATLAKLGSAPFLAKVAAGTAGAAFVTAGAVAVLPDRHQQAAVHSAPAPKQLHVAAMERHASGRPTGPTLSAVPAVRARSIEASNAGESEHRDRREPARMQERDRSSGTADRSSTEPTQNDRGGDGSSEAVDSAPQRSDPPETSGDGSQIVETTGSDGGGSSTDGGGASTDGGGASTDGGSDHPSG